MNTCTTTTYSYMLLCICMYTNNLDSITAIHIALAKCYPTYGDLLNLLDEAEQQQSDDLAHSLAQKFSMLYPHISVTREDTFLKTVQRLAAPTRPSALGPKKLQGIDLRNYKKQLWIPRIRNTKGKYYKHMHINSVYIAM